METSLSAKWRRVQAWDKEHLTGWLTPVRMVLFLFSSIRLAAIMLAGVSLYAVLASVPIGLLALIPTWGALSHLSRRCFDRARASARCVSLGSGQAARGMERAGVFLVSVAPLLLVTAAGVLIWLSFIWPAMKYDPASGGGLRLFWARSSTRTTARRSAGCRRLR